MSVLHFQRHLSSISLYTLTRELKVTESLFLHDQWCIHVWLKCFGVGQIGLFLTGMPCKAPARVRRSRKGAEVEDEEQSASGAKRTAVLPRANAPDGCVSLLFRAQLHVLQLTVRIVPIKALFCDARLLG